MHFSSDSLKFVFISQFVSNFQLCRENICLHQRKSIKNSKSKKIKLWHNFGPISILKNTIMLYKYAFLFLLVINFPAKAQKQLYIHFDTEKARISKLYILEPNGIFVLDNRAKLQAVIIGKFNKNKAVSVINDYESRRIPQRFQIQNVDILSYQLYEINYPKKYARIEEEFRDYPISINHYSLSYYDKYYDKETVKGKIKSIGDLKIKYYQEYYLKDIIKGSIAQIGRYKIKLNMHYYEPESLGLISQIGNIKIKYSKSNYEETLNGLPVSIGNYKIKYFDDIYQHSHRLGQFKKLVGNDNRLVLLN